MEHRGVGPDCFLHPLAIAVVRVISVYGAIARLDQALVLIVLTRILYFLVSERFL